jgi:hypothetical protein
LAASGSGLRLVALANAQRRGPFGPRRWLTA